jgi:hypothetical protein
MWKIFSVPCSSALYKFHCSYPVIDRGGLYGCEISRIPHCLDNRLILSALCAGHILHPVRFLALISVRGYENPQGYNAAGRIM